MTDLRDFVDGMAREIHGGSVEVSVARSQFSRMPKHRFIARARVGDVVAAATFGEDADAALRRLGAHYVASLRHLIDSDTHARLVAHGRVLGLEVAA